MCICGCRDLGKEHTPSVDDRYDLCLVLKYIFRLFQIDRVSSFILDVMNFFFFESRKKMFILQDTQNF